MVEWMRSAQDNAMVWNLCILRSDIGSCKKYLRSLFLSSWNGVFLSDFFVLFCFVFAPSPCLYFVYLSTSLNISMDIVVNYLLIHSSASLSKYLCIITFIYLFTLTFSIPCTQLNATPLKFLD